MFKQNSRAIIAIGFAVAVALMLAQPSMIKRPVLDLGGRLLVGFKPEIYKSAVRPK